MEFLLTGIPSLDSEEGPCAPLLREDSGSIYRTRRDTQLEQLSEEISLVRAQLERIQKKVDGLRSS